METGGTGTTGTSNLMEKRFRITLFLLRLGGVSLCVRNASRLICMYNSLVMSCAFTVFMAMIMDLVVHRGDLKEAMKIFRVILGSALILWLYLNMRFRMVKFERLIGLTEFFTWEDQPTRDPATGRLRWAGLITRIQNISKKIFVFTVVFHAIHISLRIATSHDLVFKAWYPFDVTTTPAYQLIILTQSIASLHFECTYFGFTILYAVLVCVACSQLEKLKSNLSAIKQRRLALQGDSAIQSETGEEGRGLVLSTESLFYYMQKQLNECVQQHQLIMQYMRELEETMNFTLCGLFLMLLITLCFVAFSAAMSLDDGIDLAEALYVYGLMMACVFAFCSLGTELSEQAESVRDAAWGCDWVGTPVPFQRCLVFIIAAANKEFTLTAGKFVPVCNQTMMNMMNQSASFFMFLLTMKDKNKETNGTE